MKKKKEIQNVFCYFVTRSLRNNVSLCFRLDKTGFGTKLKHLDLSGCLFITDMTLQRLSSAFDQGICHMTETDHMTKNDDIIVEEIAEEKVDESQCDSSTVEEIEYDNIVDCSGENKNNSVIVSMEEDNLVNACNVKVIPKMGTCCQSRVNKNSCCIKNKDVMVKRSCHVTEVSTSVDNSEEDDKIMVGVTSSFGRNVSSQNESMNIPKILKCLCCGKVDELLSGSAEKDEDHNGCFQERPCNHGSQRTCFHGRASMATDRDSCCQGEIRTEICNSVDKRLDDSNSYYNTCVIESSRCCKSVKGSKGQGHLHSDDTQMEKEDVIKNLEQESVVGKFMCKTSKNVFPEVVDQGQGSRTDISYPGNKDITDLEHISLLENEVERSESTNDQKELQNYIDYPVQTEIPMVFIMGDLDLRFGMRTPDETSTNSPDDKRIEQKVMLTKHEMKIDCRSLEFLSLSGCYLITDEGLR